MADSARCCFDWPCRLGSVVPSPPYSGSSYWIAVTSIRLSPVMNFSASRLDREDQLRRRYWEPSLPSQPIFHWERVLRLLWSWCCSALSCSCANPTTSAGMSASLTLNRQPTPREPAQQRFDRGRRRGRYLRVENPAGPATRAGRPGLNPCIPGLSKWMPQGQQRLSCI